MNPEPLSDSVSADSVASSAVLILYKRTYCSIYCGSTLYGWYQVRSVHPLYTIFILMRTGESPQAYIHAQTVHTLRDRVVPAGTCTTYMYAKKGHGTAVHGWCTRCSPHAILLMHTHIQGNISRRSAGDSSAAGSSGKQRRQRSRKEFEGARGV